MTFRTQLLQIALGSMAVASLHAAPGDEIYQKGFLSREEALNSIELKDGYRLELVLSDPEIHEPVAMAWDGNGALYVVEMRTYMQDADATGEQEPTSRISRHEDTDGDGVYDKHSVFIDNLLLPRMILPLDDRLMVGITNTLDLWNYRDSDGDGVADEKVKIHEGGKRGGNMEHQPSGLIWNLDNWIYLTYEAKRYRFTDGKLEVQNLPRGGGQWGLGQDDAGRLYYSAAGGEKPAFSFQQPIAYGALELPDQLEIGFNTVHPIAEVPDVQGGERRVGPNGGLNNFTGVAGQSIYRGDRLPAELKGDLLIPEPVGRLIRQVEVDRKDGKTVLRNVHPGEEFIRTRDVNFRPVWSATSPDGSMMFLDMHRGIIQQGNWTKPGSYLRGVIEKWGLDENIGRGRLYRLVHDSFEPDVQPRMLEESTAGLVAHLSHPNGWWRDTAQKLIILREDRESVVPALEGLLTGGESELGRLHALWTLEGMNRLSAALVTKALADDSSLVRTSAIRCAEPYLAADDAEVITALTGSPHLAGDADIEMVIQAFNSINTSARDSAGLIAFRDRIATDFKDHPVISALTNAKETARKYRQAVAERKKYGPAYAKSLENGKIIYEQLCFACHGNDGTGAPMPGNEGEKLAPSFVDSPRVVGNGNSVILTLLHGLSGDLDGREYEGLMVGMANNDDAWIADASNYIRNSFGNQAPLITPDKVAALRKAHASRAEPWTQAELEALEPKPLDRKAWKLTASHGTKDLPAAIDGKANTRYTSKAEQAPGMWLQIEFPEETAIGSIVLDSAASPRDFPAAYEVHVSGDGRDWGKKALAKGKGIDAVTRIELPEGTKARFVKITQTGRKSRLFWSIHELQVYEK